MRPWLRWICRDEIVVMKRLKAMADKIVVRNLYKVFGGEPETAVHMLQSGAGKDEVLEKTGQVVGVWDANFAIQEGEIFVVMGLSGSGKSTLVRLLNRLIEPTHGEVLFDGVDIVKMNDRDLLDLRRKSLAMVFQSFALMPHLTVTENTAFGLELAGVDRDERIRRALEALDQVGLSAYAASYPDELSGGMQQRVGLARALANDPSVMLMDEAFSALDPLIRAEMQDELLRLQAANKRTVVFISHDLDEAFRIGDRIAIMEGGRVVQIGTPEEILNNPADDYVRSFFRGVDVSTVLTAADICRRSQTTVIEREGVGIRAALQRLREQDNDIGYVVGPQMRFQGVVTAAALGEAHKAGRALHDAFLADVPVVEARTPLADLIGTVGSAPCPLPVVDENGRYRGVISRGTLLRALDRGLDHAEEPAAHA